MVVGICFISIGVFIYIVENYNIETLDGERVFSKKEDIIKDRKYRYKILTSVFSLLLGVFRILSRIIY
ncbi:hypothetical protein [Tissierella praeacuta]|uniref:hypothetical protein n=1 Tax=Tissierella praeacuta TaxID=43131 RepID=UPI003342AF09